MSYIPLLGSPPGNAPAGRRRRTPVGCRAEERTTAPATVTSAYTADSARLAAASLMRLFMDQGVLGFGPARPEDLEGGPGAGVERPAVPAGAADDQDAAESGRRAASASTAAAPGSPAAGRAARNASPSAPRRRRRRVRFVRRGLVAGRTQAAEGRHGQYASATPHGTVPSDPAVVHDGEEER